MTKMAISDKTKTAKRRLSNYLLLKTNFFTKNFLTFTIAFLIMLIVLGTSMLILMNRYTEEYQTELLIYNTKSIKENAESLLTIEEMDSEYSRDKMIICSTLARISKSIDADLFICDVNGNIIFCAERADTPQGSERIMPCPWHDERHISIATLETVYQQGEVVKETQLSGVPSYVVARPIISNGEPIGTVFAVTDTGVRPLAMNTFKIFLISAFFCFILAFISIYYLTKSMVKPLQQMSNATKQFAAGDFSYRIKVRGNDELADLATAFNDMAEALDVLETSRRSFVSNVSHELKTPMTSIAGFIDGILDGTVPEEKRRYYLVIVSAEVRRLSRLVVSMLNMSKIESGDIEMKPSEYDLSDQMIHILLNFEQNITEKNIAIRGLDNLPHTQVVADSDMIYQAIYNLFDNAVKFTNENGYIEISMRDWGTSVEVTIKNSGNGIKEEEIAHLFERFYKVDKSRSLDSKGAGLGLYIVKLMIEMHGGRVSADSDGVKTATFTFTLPKQFSPRYNHKEKQ